MKKYLKWISIGVIIIGIVVLFAPYIVSQAVKTGITNEKSGEIDRSESISEEIVVDGEVDSYFSETNSGKVSK